MEDKLKNFKVLDIKKIRERVEQELEFDEYSMKKENQDNSTKHHYWITLTHDERDKLNFLYRLQKELRSMLYLYYRWGDTQLYKERFQKMVTSWTEIEVLIKGNKKWLKLDRIVKKQEEIVKYLEKVEGLFYSRNFAIRGAMQAHEKEKMGI